MRFNVVRVSIFVFVTIFLQPGRGAAFAQIDSQALGNTVSQQCSPLDPTCLAGSASQLGVGQIQPSMQPSQSQYPLQPGNLNPLQGATSTGLAEQLREQQLLLEQELMKSRLPLDAPTGFQQMVANSIGKMLPIYGASLFRNPPSTFAPVNQVPVDAGYVIGPGDELRIEAWGQVSLDSSFAVDRSGAIYIPQVGSVHVAGLRFDQAQPFLKTQIGRTFRNFDLSVSMGRLRSMQVFVVGEARRPGSWTISSLSTLVNAIFAVGGPTPEGSLRHIQLKRDGKLVVEFDLYDLLLRGDKSKDARLLPGDVIYFPPVGPQVAVAGSVKVPGIYELRSADNTTVEDVLDLAAGMSNVASGDKVRLERIDEHRERSIKEVALDAAGLATVVNDGDLLELEALAGLYKDAVTLRGNVASPGRYRWQPGMRVLDLIPNKEALVTRDYWLKRVQMGQPTLTYIPTCPPRTPFGVPSLRYGIAAGEEGEDPLWRYSTTTPQSARQLGAPIGVDGTKAALAGSSQTGGIYLYGYPGSPGNPSNPASSGSPAVTDGGLDCDTGQQSTQPSGQPTDQQTGQPTMNDSTASTSAAAAFVGVTAGSATAGQFTPRNDVKLSEPDIDWSYAVIERQNKQDLTTSLLPFNLGRAVLAGDASQNLELMPGDVVTIFSKADIRVPQAEQTRFVRLEGEFVSSGVYSVHPGETLRQLVERAGGLTPSAYLFGSEFTRESTRRLQQQRLTEYVNQITLQASIVASANAGRSINPQDTAAAATQQQQNQNIVNALRQARATGRIVLELPPDASNATQLPDMPLEDGDRFIVPRIPSTVNVNGAVYNQNSFLYNPRRRLGDYVRLAGGANRDADRNRAYVIRASGAVVSRQYSSSLRGNGFGALRMFPGDTVIIPLNLDRGKGMRLVVDLAQIFGQFGLAVAAANTVF